MLSYLPRGPRGTRRVRHAAGDAAIPMKASSNVSPVREGEVVSGRYRVERVLGVGGMGVVVHATDQRLGNPVAIKFLLPDALEHPEIVARFAREARAAVKIRSEHVARVMDVGTLDSGAPYMVMEYLEGCDLSTELAQNGALPVEDVVDFVLQASEALVEAHQFGFVHRDLKPANLFLVAGRGAPVVKVLDFGISKTSSFVGGTGSGAAFTQTASLLGSPLYMSPEQMDSARSVDARTDIWALGVIFYELLSGEPPFSGESMPQLCMAILQQTPRALRVARPDVPARLEAVILRCLEKDRERRFANVQELAVALAEFSPPRSCISLERISAASEGDVNSGDPERVSGSSTRAAAFSGRVPGAVGSRPNTPRGVARRTPVRSFTEQEVHETQATFGRTSSERRGPYFMLFAFGVPVLVAAGLLVFLLGRRGSQPEPPAVSGSAAAALSPSAPSPAPAETPSSLPTVDTSEPVRAPGPSVVPGVEASPTSVFTPESPLPAPRPRAKTRPPAGASHEPAAPAHTSHGPKTPTDSWEDER
jgi:serine/threonine protein kinase